MLARKQASLAEAKEDLDTTVEDHIIELRTEGLDSLRDELNETYEKWKKDLALNIDSVINTISDTANNISGSILGLNSTTEKFLHTFNSRLETEDLGIEKFTKQNVSEIPEIDFSKDIAAQLKHYEDNLSEDEYLRWKILQGTNNETKEYTADILQDTHDINTGMFGTKENTEDSASTQAETSDTVADVADTSSEIQNGVNDTKETVQDIATTQQSFSETMSVLGQDFMPAMQDSTEAIQGDMAVVKEKGIEAQETMVTEQDETNANLLNISEKLNSVIDNTSILVPIEYSTDIINSTLKSILTAVSSINSDTYTAVGSGWDAITTSNVQNMFEQSVKSASKTATATTKSSTPSVSVGSVITVEGNVDKYVVDDLKELGSQLTNDPFFMNEIYVGTAKISKQESKKRT